MSAASDTHARRKLAELARHLASGQITNDDFEDQRPLSSARAVKDVYFYGLWPLYDDLITHRLVGRRALTSEGRAWVARIVLFLRSETPYRYPHPNLAMSLAMFPISVLTLGWAGRTWLRYLWRHGDQSVWPFYSKEELELALRKPTYLAGTDA